MYDINLLASTLSLSSYSIFSTLKYGEFKYV